MIDDAGGLITGMVGLGVGLAVTGMVINMTNENVNNLIDKGKGRKPRKVKPIVTGYDKMFKAPKPKPKRIKAKPKPGSKKSIKKRSARY